MGNVPLPAGMQPRNCVNAQKHPSPSNRCGSEIFMVVEAVKGGCCNRESTQTCTADAGML